MADPCLRCLRVEATAADEAVWHAICHDGREVPDDWPDDEGSHLCWRAIADGECCPEGPMVRVTSGQVVLHDGDFVLLSAPVEDVMALWAGLGYYTRARNLHRCAQAVVDMHGGEFPREVELLAELPGIGPSTAAAIAAASLFAAARAASAALAASTTASSAPCGW